MSYTFLDAYASVQTADSSVVSGTTQRPIVNIGSLLSGIPILPASVSGTVGASVIGLTPVAVTNIPSVSGTVGASVIGTVPVTQAGAWSASLVGVIPGSVASYQAGPWSASLVGTIPGSVIAFQGTTPWATAGSVVSFQGTNPWVVQSIVGTYAEDAAHTSADKGLFVLGVRNDTVASFAGANTEYSPVGVDAAGRVITKPFAPDPANVRGIASNVGTSVTSLLPAAGTGLRNYITDLIAVNSGAATAIVNIRDSDASILTRLIVPAGGGSNLPGLATPLRTGGLNSHVDMVPLTPSSMITITALGYIAP